MAFPDLEKLYMRKVANQHGGDSITWYERGRSASAGTTIGAVVDETPEVLHESNISSNPDAPSPIEVLVSRTDAPTVSLGEGSDSQLEYGSGVYTVAIIVESSPGIWRLYCVR